MPHKKPKDHKGTGKTDCECECECHCCDCCRCNENHLKNHDKNCKDHDKDCKDHDKDCKGHDKDCKDHDKDCKDHDKDCKDHDKDCKDHDRDCKDHDKDCKDHDRDCKDHDKDCKDHDRDCKDHDKDCKDHDNFIKECICIKFAVPHEKTQIVFMSEGVKKLLAVGSVSYDCGIAPFIIVRFFDHYKQIGPDIKIWKDSSLAFIKTGFEKITVTCPNLADDSEFHWDDDWEEEAPDACEGKLCLKLRFCTDENCKNSKDKHC